MSRRRRRRRGGERERTRYPHHGTLSSRGRWSPKDNDLASAAAATVRTVLSSRIPRLPISFTPRFPCSPPPLDPPRTTLLASPLPLRHLFRQRLLSFSFPFSFAWREPHERAHFFFSIGNYQWTTPRWLRSVEDALRRRYLLSINPIVETLGVFRTLPDIRVQTYFLKDTPLQLSTIINYQ